MLRLLGGKDAAMGWHVRYIDQALKHELLSQEWATEEEALEDAWNLAQQDGIEITAIEGPDEETVPMEDVQAWFDHRIKKEAGPS
ncbi:hypothetical protein CWB41_02475 [Methylovirgula ligni]|jgi:hypothetical protein|uniref:Uncharacterized protein n=2 Tax=Methylovirgula ligni TaxID=569860 RepID=A0A3D9Z028_9HYPH|nr:hypothetical protein CWB41_02475 [Methylovirgula ligni]REF87360.1 hypothetical protein DES32_0980 [Methylovirgula ligni]